LSGIRYSKKTNGERIGGFDDCRLEIVDWYLVIGEEHMAVAEGSESSLAVSAKPKDLIERVEGFCMVAPDKIRVREGCELMYCTFQNKWANLALY
jgi:hypothetical protein